jgi:hypothetical protein
MISFDKQCIFVHIPKTGGTSIENAIWGSDWSKRTTDQLWMGNVRPGFNKYQSGGLQHLLATQIRQEVGQEKFDRYFKFSFVRNPWDKLVSQFLYLKTQPMLRDYMGVGRWTSFKKYVRILLDNHEMHVQSYEQWRFIYDDKGNRLVDFLGRFESLDDDFTRLTEKLGLKGLRLPHDMKSRQRKPYQMYYDDRTAELVLYLYARDVELFDYQFDC